MSNYYQQKKNYNKYNSSFSDLDCYGSNYFNNEKKSDYKTNYSNNSYTNNSNPYSNKTHNTNSSFNNKENNYGNKTNFSNNTYSNSNPYSQRPQNNNFSSSNNTFGNKLNNKPNPYANRFSSKSNDDDFYLDDSTKYDTSLFQRNSPLGIFFVIYMFGLMISFLISANSWSNVVSGSAFSKAFFYTLLESPILYFVVWKLILANLSKAFLALGGDRFIVGIMSAIAIPLIAIIINCGILHHRNQSLDSSSTITRYLAVTSKQVHSHRNSKSHRTTYTYHVYLTSWVSDGTISIKVPQDEYNHYDEGDIIKVNTRSGFYGYQYYESISPYNKVDRNLFPPNTVFPLTETQAQKLMEEKELYDLKKGKNRNKYGYEDY